MSGIGGSLENVLDPADLLHNQSHRSVHNFLANQLDPGNLSGENRDAYNGNGGAINGTLTNPGQVPVTYGNPIIPGQTGTSTGSVFPQGTGTGGAFTPVDPNLPTNGQGTPTMQGYGFTWYGGQAPTPEGGYYNQMAQAMAGPSYAPVGTQWNMQSAPQAYPQLPLQTPTSQGSGQPPVITPAMVQRNAPAPQVVAPVTTPQVIAPIVTPAIVPQVPQLPQVTPSQAPIFTPAIVPNVTAQTPLVTRNPKILGGYGIGSQVPGLRNQVPGRLMNARMF